MSPGATYEYSYSYERPGVVRRRTASVMMPPRRDIPYLASFTCDTEHESFLWNVTGGELQIADLPAKSFQFGAACCWVPGAVAFRSARHRGAHRGHCAYPYQQCTRAGGLRHFYNRAAHKEDARISQQLSEKTGVGRSQTVQDAISNSVAASKSGQLLISSVPGLACRTVLLYITAPISPHCTTTLRSGVEWSRSRPLCARSPF